MARVLFAVLATAVVVGAAVYVNELLREPASPAERLRGALTEPWVGNSSSYFDELVPAVNQSPDDELSVSVTLTLVAPEREARLSASITGPTGNPLIRAVREGHARGEGFGLAFIVGAFPDMEWGLVYRDPRVTTTGAVSTVTVQARGVINPEGTTIVRVIPSYYLCDKLKRRTITVAAVGMEVASVGARPPPRQVDRSCGGPGVWQDQAPTRALYIGGGEASVGLARDVAPGGVSQAKALLPQGTEVGQLVTTGGFVLVSGIPLFIAWRRTRGGKSEEQRPELGRWAAGNPVGTRTADAVGMLLVFHVLVGAGLITSIALSTVDEMFGVTVWSGITPTALVVALAFVWRRITLRNVTRSTRGLARPAVDQACLVVAAASLFVLCGMVWADSEPSADSPSWLLTGEGIWALMLAASVGLVPTAIYLLVARPALRSALGATLQSLPLALLAVMLAIAAGIAVLCMIGVQLGLMGAPLLLDAGEWWWLSPEPSWTDWYRTPFGRLTGLYLGVVAAVLGTVVLTRALRLGARNSLTVVAGTVLTLALLMAFPLTETGGVLADIVGSAVPLIASVLVVLTVERVVCHVVDAHPPVRGWRPGSPAWRILRVVVAVVLALPFVVYGGEWAPLISWYDFGTFASSVDGALPLVGVVLLVTLLRYLGSADGGDRTRGSLNLLRATAVLIGVLGLLTTSATVAGLPIAFLVGWLMFEVWLMPRPRDGTGRPLVGEAADDEVRSALGTVIRDVTKTRTEHELEKELRGNLAGDPPDADGQDERVLRVTELAVRERTTHRELRVALSSYGRPGAWGRARTLAVVGFAAGLPWTVLDISAVLGTLTGGGQFRVVDAAAGLLVILRFGIAGLVMGAAYPVIRGATGLGKGLSMFVALAAPALCVTLLPDPRADNALAGALLQLVQWLSFGLATGLTADWLTLRRHGYGLRHLRELHRMNALTASASTLLLAVLTAAATAVGTGAAGVFVERVLTPAPAPAVAPQEPNAPPGEG